MIEHRSYECEICGAHYESQETAEACESQEELFSSLNIGSKYRFPSSGVIIVLLKKKTCVKSHDPCAKTPYVYDSLTPHKGIISYQIVFDPEINQFGREISWISNLEEIASLQEVVE